MNLEIFKRKNYFLFLILGLMFLLFSFFKNNDETLDVNIHDTYYVIAHSHLQFFNFLVLFVLFCVYLALEKLRFPTNRILSNLHIYITCVSILGICYPNIFLFPVLFEDSMNLIVAIMGMLLFIVQIVLVINIGIGIFRIIRKKSL